MTVSRFHMSECLITSLHGVRDSLEENINKFYEDVLETITVKSSVLLCVEQLMLKQLEKRSARWQKVGRCRTQEVNQRDIVSHRQQSMQVGNHLGFETQIRYR